MSIDPGPQNSFKTNSSILCVRTRIGGIFYVFFLNMTIILSSTDMVHTNIGVFFIVL